ncbi:hypothetical protein BWK69_00320 [Candidatus Parcubacteria bacterium A4]|nr:MAG: hypothetical protein BWK69_00320 [Candidatus Parcubacteria bacterium A4]
MSWVPFKNVPKNFLGIDIGTSSIKIVELSKEKGEIILKNYGEVTISDIRQNHFREVEREALRLSPENVSQVILDIVKEAKIETKKAVFSIPDFSSFFTNLELPAMTKEELPQAVIFEAKKHIPLPLKDVIIDWEIIEKENVDKNRAKWKILLVAVPNYIIDQYQTIANLSGLELVALEAEVFSLARALTSKEDRQTVLLMDIGAKSTTCNVVMSGSLKKSYSFNVSGNDMTNKLAEKLFIDYNKAESIKKRYGLLAAKELTMSSNVVREVLSPFFDILFKEVKEVSESFCKKNNQEINKYIISGGSALTAGVKQYFKDYFDKDIEIANPFNSVLFQPILEERLKEIGPAYAVAVGVAMRELRD